MTDTSSAADTNSDQAILSADKRKRYVLQRLRTRRKMALIAFAQFVFGGAAIVIGGLLLPSWADRIDHMGTFLSIYFTTLAGVIMAYWGIGSYERNSYGSEDNVGWGASFESPESPERPLLVKTPRGAG